MSAHRWCLGFAVALLAGVPAGAEAVEFGRSSEGRPIGLTIRGPEDARARVLVVGSVHGDEPAGLVVTRRLKRNKPPPGVRFAIVGALNPDGLVRRTRQNARGVDLNRNFPTGWRRGHRGSRYYPGPRPLSEPESRFAAKLIDWLQPDVTVWFHQPYGLVDRRSRRADPYVLRYSRASGLPARRIPGVLRGTATAWQNATQPGTAFVVELPAGRISRSVATRHARAVRAVAMLAARENAASFNATDERRKHGGRTTGRGDLAGRALHG